MTPRTPAQDRLAELDEIARQARERLAELEGERSASHRKLAAARGPLDAYYDAVGAGEREPDAALEGELLAGLAETKVHVRYEVSPAEPRHMIAVDQRTEALVAGARRALTAAEQEVALYLRLHAADLAAEFIPEAEKARAGLEVALPALAAADRADQHVRGKWRRLLRALDAPATDLPPSPLRGWADELAQTGGQVPLAVPDSFRAREGDEEAEAA